MYCKTSFLVAFLANARQMHAQVSRPSRFLTFFFSLKFSIDAMMDLRVGNVALHLGRSIVTQSAYVCALQAGGMGRTSTLLILFLLVFATSLRDGRIRVTTLRNHVPTVQLRRRPQTERMCRSGAQRPTLPHPAHAKRWKRVRKEDHTTIQILTDIDP
jgi:hypothetical protein